MPAATWLGPQTSRVPELTNRCVLHTNHMHLSCWWQLICHPFELLIEHTILSSKFNSISPDSSMCWRGCAQLCGHCGHLVVGSNVLATYQTMLYTITIVADHMWHAQILPLPLSICGPPHVESIAPPFHMWTPPC